MKKYYAAVFYRPKTGSYLRIRLEAGRTTPDSEHLAEMRRTGFIYRCSTEITGKGKL